MLPEGRVGGLEEPVSKQKISWWRTKLGDDEIFRVAQAISNENISQGPVVAEFESRLCQLLGVPYVVATTSGSVALLMALMAAGVGPDDEVIIPNRTWISSAHAAVLLGAKVRFVDVEADRTIIDTTKIEEIVTPRSKAIIPTHLNGQAANMREIRRIAHKHGMHVIEDAAQALGSRNVDGLLGTQSDMGCFSLSVAKIITTGQGGFIATRESSLYEKLVSIRTHGIRSVMEPEWAQLGFNFRFSDIQASIGLVQLDKLEQHLEQVKAIYSRYVEAMPELPFLRLLEINVKAGEIPVYTQVLCEERASLIEYLSRRGIEVRPFYPSLNLASYFENDACFPNSEKFGQQGIFLPSGPSQPLENIDRVISALRAYPGRA